MCSLKAAKIGHLTSSFRGWFLLTPVLCMKQSASGLVVKSNVAIVGPPVRFRACAVVFFNIFFIAGLLG